MQYSVVYAAKMQTKCSDVSFVQLINNILRLIITQYGLCDSEVKLRLYNRMHACDTFLFLKLPQVMYNNIC